MTSDLPQLPRSAMGSRIDPYAGQYASRARGMVASEIRALFAVASRPEIVSLAGGSPFVSALPLEAVGDMVGGLIASRGQDVLQNCTAQGDVTLREQICCSSSHPGAVPRSARRRRTVPPTRVTLLERAADRTS